MKNETLSGTEIVRTCPTTDQDEINPMGFENFKVSFRKDELTGRRYRKITWTNDGVEWAEYTWMSD